MTSATDELRRMLDERGVEWERGLPTETIVRKPIDVLYVERPDGRMHTYVRSYFTPEQAIAATLGAGTCHNVHEPPRNTTFWPTPHFKCSECGEVHVSMQYVFYCPNCGAKVVDDG